MVDVRRMDGATEWLTVCTEKMNICEISCWTFLSSTRGHLNKSESVDWAISHILFQLPNIPHGISNVLRSFHTPNVLKSVSSTSPAFFFVTEVSVFSLKMLRSFVSVPSILRGEMSIPQRSSDFDSAVELLSIDLRGMHWSNDWTETPRFLSHRQSNTSNGRTLCSPGFGESSLRKESFVFSTLDPVNL